MNLKALSIPESFPEIGAWLDDLLVSPDLIDTIVQLEVLAGDRLSTVQSLDGVLATDRNIVLESGLAGGSETTIRALLRQPSLLLELQEQVMMLGGDYWQRKTNATFSSPDVREVVARPPAGRRQSISAGGTSANANRDTAPVTEATDTGWSRKKIVGAIAALAAGVLIMVFIAQGTGPTVAKSGWGFSESGLLKSKVSEPEMLGLLAKASEAWHKKPLHTNQELANRLRDFDQGCQALLASPLPQLSVSNRNAVHAACEDCRAAIATQLAAIDRGVDFKVVRSEADEAISKLTRAIQRLS